MKIRRFYGKDMREALNQVKHELGSDAVIMSNKKVADGIEIVAAYDKEPDPASRPATPPEPVAIAIPRPKPVARQSKAMTSAPAKKSTPTLSEIIGDSGPDSLKALLEKQTAERAPEKAEVVADKNAVMPEMKQKPAVSQVPPQDSQAMAEIKDELKSLRNVLEFQVSGLIRQEQQQAHPLQYYLTERLESMGISPALAREVVSYTPEGTNEREAWLFLLKLLANRLKTTGNDILSGGGVVALMGATGTGKTTTIAKLAAQYAQKFGSDQVALVTIDSYRIAAYEQLATYGKIIGCTVKKAVTVEELSDVLYQLRNKKLVLIDTAGFSQRDARLIKQLDTLNQTSCVKIKKYLVMQANTQRQAMERTLSTYKNVKLEACIFTKLDECYSLGEAVNIAIQHRLPVGYLTDGQKVPEDIKVAETKYLISAAAKLFKKYGITHTISQQDVNSAVAV